MAHKSESTSPQTGVETANEVQLEELKPQMASDVSISESKVEAEQPSEADIETFMHIAQQLESELCSIVVGQERVIRELLLALFAGGHVLLEGVPGLGKTLLVRTLSDALELKFARIQFTPDLMPADIVGTTIVTEQSDHLTAGSRRVFSFQPGPIFANIVLADEINRATPKTQSALLEGMQEYTVSVGDATRPLPRPFFVLGTQNPLEMEGTYPLPEAQLDQSSRSFPESKGFDADYRYNCWNANTAGQTGYFWRTIDTLNKDRPSCSSSYACKGVCGTPFVGNSSRSGGCPGFCSQIRSIWSQPSRLASTHYDK